MQNLGLKCGIEIHQQLEGKKLFCNCPTILRDDEAHFKIERRLRASAGESGEVDIAAKEEQQKNKMFTYEGYSDSTCLIEADAEPPRAINQDALTSALQFAKLSKSQIIPIIQVMRKTVVDGSNTSGFQRTALVARNGIIETSLGTVRIDNINIEEDSSKIIANTSSSKTYRLDRLGIPLIEIGTAPDITTPEQAQETAKKIGLLLRSLPNCKRGLGTIRQDLNISITGGTRIELKGAQDLKLIPLYIELEAKRQHELLQLRDYLETHNINLAPLNIIDLTEKIKTSTSKIVQKTIEKKGKILGFKLEKFKGLVGKELQPNYRLGTEFSGRAKIIAGVGGIFHSDELPNYGIREEEVNIIKRELQVAEPDAFIIVADDESKSHQALRAVHARAQELWFGIPKEVRKANADGTSSYLRPMPGAARMYPETDVPLIRPNTKNITLPETIEEKIIRYQATPLSLSKDLAVHTATSDCIILFEELSKKYPKIKAAFIAETITSTPTDIKRTHNLNSDKLTDDNFRTLFKYLSEDKIHKDIVIDVLIDMIKGTFDIKRYVSLATEELHHDIIEIIKVNPNAPFSALMGLCVKKFQGKASGQFISQELKKLIDQGHK